MERILRISQRLRLQAGRQLRQTWKWVGEQGIRWQLAAVIGLTIVLPIVNWLDEQASYNIAPAAALIMKSPQALQQYLSYDAKNAAYKFTPPDRVALSAGQSLGGADYSASLPSDAKQGISVTDPQYKQSVSFTPAFGVNNAKNVQGHIVYPLTSAHGQLIYTLAGNALKEDIVLYGSMSDQANFSYKLQIPAGLEARMMPDGSVGFYGADPVLYGNINYGSDSDRQKVELAKQKQPKNYLMYAIPAPVVKGSNSAKAEFRLNGEQLTVQVNGLGKAHFPLTIDPSFVLSSSADWAKGQNEDNIDFSVANQIGRADVTGGTIDSNGWVANATGAASNAGGYPVVAYNGRLYQAYGGTVYYASLNSSTGAVSSWTSSSSWNASYGTTGPQNLVLYNGFLYLVNGLDTGNTTAVQYAKINSDGTVGSWVLSANQTTASHGNAGSAIAYNGYLYAVTGYSTAGGGYTAVSEYAPIHSDGSLGSWTATSAFPQGQTFGGLAAYNGVLYMVGGNNGNTPSSSVYMAHVKSDGTLGTWVATASISGARMGVGITQLNGYLYIMGGCTSLSSGSSCNTAGLQSDTQFAAVNSDGTLKNWQTTAAAFANARWKTEATSYNGYLYILGGCLGTTGCGSSGFLSDLQYSKVDSAGALGKSVTLSPSLNYTARNAAAVATHAGYIYVAGGCNTATCSTANGFLTDVAYAKLGTDGTLGDAGCGANAWCDFTSSALPGGTAAICTAGSIQGRAGAGAVIYNGWLYVSGGLAPTGTIVCNSTAVMNDVVAIRLGAVQDAGGAPQGSWTAAGSNTWSTASWGVSAVTFSSTLYVIGGDNNAGGTTSLVRYATINGDGTLGAFATTSAGMTISRTFAAAVVAKGALYVLGGYTGSNASSDVIYGVISSNGNISSWTDLGNQSWSARRYVQANYFNGKIYISGGMNASNTILSDIEYAQVNDNHTLGSWVDSPVSLTTARAAAGSVIVNGFLVQVDGCTAVSTNCTAFTNNTEVVPLNNGGSGVAVKATVDANQLVPLSCGSCTRYAGPTISNRTDYQMLALNGYLYVIGGCNDYDPGQTVCSNPLTDVQYSKINTDGSLGAWAQTGALTGISGAGHSASGTRTGAHGFVAGGALYVGGGCESWNLSTGGCNNTLTDVLYAVPAANGTISSWNDSGGTLTNSANHIEYYNGYMYQIVQTTTSTAIKYAAVNLSTHAIGANSNTASPNLSRASLDTTIYNGYMYIGGGYSTNGDPPRSDVEFAKINSNGTLGSFNFTSNMPFNVQSGDFEAVNGYLIALPGWTGGSFGGFSGNCYNHISAAPIMSDGSLGQWTESSTILDTTYTFLFHAVSNGMVYTSGSCGSPRSFDGSIREIAFAAQPRVAHYSKLMATDQPTMPSNFFANLSQLALNSSITFSLATASTASGSFGNFTSWNNPSPWTKNPVSVPGTGAGGYFLNIMLDDSRSYAFGAGASTVNFFQLNYHPNPSTRLRGGKTFNSGQVQSLDAP